MVKIKVEGSELQEIISMLSSMQSPQGLPATAKAVEQAAQVVQGLWHNYAIGKGSLTGVPPMKNPSQGYAKGIKIERPGPFRRVIVNESKTAEFLEYGTPELDMKKTHTKGPRSRVAPTIISKRTGKVLQKGGPYLIVPFRWGTPKTVGFNQVMPVDIYAIVKKFKKMQTRVSADDSPEEDKTPNARGEMVGRAKYNKGYSRLTMKQIAEANDGEVSINQMFNMNGMVRTTDITGKDRSGGYFTFRVISANSRPDSWIKPATPARNVIEGLMKAAKEPVDTILEAGFRRDLGL
jgi:hypothetical protein